LLKEEELDNIFKGEYVAGSLRFHTFLILNSGSIGERIIEAGTRGNLRRRQVGGKREILAGRQFKAGPNRWYSTKKRFDKKGSEEVPRKSEGV